MILLLKELSEYVLNMEGVKGVRFPDVQAVPEGDMNFVFVMVVENAVSLIIAQQ